MDPEQRELDQVEDEEAEEHRRGDMRRLGEVVGKVLHARQSARGLLCNVLEPLYLEGRPDSLQHDLDTLASLLKGEDRVSDKLGLEGSAF